MANLLSKYVGESNPTVLREQFFAPFEQVFDQFFSDFWDHSHMDKIKSTGTLPRMDIGTEGDNFVIHAIVAGVKPEDIHVEMLPQGYVRVSGQVEQLPQNGVYAYREISRRQFVKEVKLPEALKDVDPEASIKDGILTLAWPLPKGVNKAVTREIPIRLTKE